MKKYELSNGETITLWAVRVLLRSTAFVFVQLTKTERMKRRVGSSRKRVQHFIMFILCLAMKWPKLFGVIVMFFS